MTAGEALAPHRRYPRRPIAGVGVVVVDGGRILLVQRGNRPAQGLWSVPGGAIELGETARQAARREVREETGLTVEIGRVVDVVDIITRDKQDNVEFHYLLVDFLGTCSGGKLQAGSDVTDCRWVTAEELAMLPTTETLPPLLEKVFRAK